ncbi:hypothetical protein ACFL2S_15250 [Thermodesulfobacteriota bacterium]
MKLYHASLITKVLLKYHELFPDKKLNVLRSFGNLSHEMLDFCKTYRGIIDSLIFDSDFIGDADETNYINHVTLEGRGLKPVPVVHDIHGNEIKHYTDKGCEKYPIVAIGSTQMKSVRTLDYVMSEFQGTGIKIHLFGKCKFELLVNFPIYSCDSTAWSHRGQYGFIYYWNRHNDGINLTDKIYMEEYLEAGKEHKITYSNYEYRDELDNYLYDTLGVTESDLLGPDGAFYKQLVNLHYYVQLEEIVNEIHRQKGFNTN